jgi:hypothetical protein
MRGQSRRVARRTSRRTARRQNYFNNQDQGADYNQPVDQEQAAPAEDIPGELKQLGELHSSGVLTDDEFNAKKADLLSRM